MRGNILSKHMTKCKACGKEIAKGVKKCVHCGKDQRNFFMRHKIFTGFLVIIILVIITSLSGKDDDTKVDNDNKAAESNSVKGDKKVEDDKKAADNVPNEHKAALKKAKTYAESMDMSKAAVYDQLVSEHGEKFPEDAAQYAIDNLEIDWKENALKKAKTYVDEMDMSKAAVYDQLVSDYGEKFTKEEAQYAVDHLE